MMNFSKNLSYKARNTLIIAVFLIVILLVGGYFVLFSYPQKIDAATTELNELKKQISMYDGIEQQFVLIQKQILIEQQKLSNLNKQIVPTVTSSNSYSYLNSIMEYSGVLLFDMTFLGSEQTNGYGFNRCYLKGEGQFEKIFKLMWYLERGPQIYKIKRLLLRGIDSPDRGKSNMLITFEMEIWALFADVNDLPPIKRQLSDVRFSRVENPFYPRVKPNLPPNIGNYLVVKRATLKAVIPGKAFVADRSGKIHVLKEGDKVYLGYVTKIDATNGRVEFTLNRHGIIEKFFLKIRFE